MTMKMSLVDFLEHQGIKHAQTSAITTAVIVAIPSEMDSIRLVGDEEKHATILFLGETSTLPPEAKTVILESLATAAQAFPTFSEGVQEVARLGSDVPPALVAMLSKGHLGHLRDVLQINPDLVTYMSNIAQHPSYTPHVTLGYPDYQGEVALRELAKKVYSVNFDRLALWWNDERFEFDLGLGGPMSADNSMKMSVDDFLEHQGVSPGTLAHAEKTVQDVYDSLNEDQRDFAAVVIGADIEGVDVPEDIDLQVIYDTFSLEQKYVLDFIAGGIDQAIEHDALSGEFLAHFGTKGMKWGVRKERGSSTALSKNVTTVQRQQARAKVKAGTGSLKDAHVASIKSTGHRAINAFLGDKTYWKRTAIIAGVALGVAGVATFGPGLMSAGLLAGVAKGVYGASSVSTSAAWNAQLGAGFIKSAGQHLALAGFAVARTVNVVDNTVRAVRGNARINKSHEALGKELVKHQQDGSKRVQGVLKRNGSLRKKNLTHADDLVDDFLAHHGIRGMKWGIRRNRDSGGDGSSGSGSKNMSGDQKKMDKAPVGAVGTATKPDGSSMLLIKKKNGEWEETFLAVDAERFIKTRQKQGHELSDREITEALKRARAVNDYNQFFSDKVDPNSDLQGKVNRLSLEKQYKDLKREMNPPKKTLVQKFTTGAEDAYKGYTVIDKFSGGAVSKKVNSKIAKAFADVTDAAKAAKVPNTPGTKSAPPAPWAPKNSKKSTDMPNPFRSPFKVRTNPTRASANNGQTFKITDLGDVKFSYPDPNILALPPGK